MAGYASETRLQFGQHRVTQPIMAKNVDILCIGSVLWDIIGRHAGNMRAGADVPGQITRLPGGVAMNIAMALNGFGMRAVLLSAVGKDAEGQELLDAAHAMGLVTTHVHRFEGMATDRYMAIEGANGLIAAIADAHSLEAAGMRILTPLVDGSLADRAHRWVGPVVLDGNLTAEMLLQIAQGEMFHQSDLRIAPASPGKAARLNAFLGGGHAMLYVNLEEAGILCKRDFDHSKDAASGLLDMGVSRVLVTHGAKPATEATNERMQSLTPPDVKVLRITGAGDVCMAAHIAAEYRGDDAETAFLSALHTTADYISSETPL